MSKLLEEFIAELTASSHERTHPRAGQPHTFCFPLSRSPATLSQPDLCWHSHA